MVVRKPRTSAGSGFQSTYSGGSKAGNRFTSRESFFELAEEAGSGGRRGTGQGVPEVDCGGETVVRFCLQRLDEGLFPRLWPIGPQLADGLRLAAEPRDHHPLRVGAWNGSLPVNISKATMPSA